jgi:aryl-alcohol dehydrogenase-like predicted oxidoreductase
MPQYAQQKALIAIDQYVALAHDIGITPVPLALAWVNGRGFVTSNIIGATSMNQLAECISSADIKLSSDTYARIDEIHTQIPNPGCF